jgi:hypothetical protein
VQTLYYTTDISAYVTVFVSLSGSFRSSLLLFGLSFGEKIHYRVFCVLPHASITVGGERWQRCLCLGVRKVQARSSLIWLQDGHLSIISVFILSSHYPLKGGDVDNARIQHCCRGISIYCVGSQNMLLFFVCLGDLLCCKI